MTKFQSYICVELTRKVLIKLELNLATYTAAVFKLDWPVYFGKLWLRLIKWAGDHWVINSEWSSQVIEWKHGSRGQYRQFILMHLKLKSNKIKFVRNLDYDFMNL